MKINKRVEEILEALKQVLAEAKLELHPVKTKLVYCKDSIRKGDLEQVRFDFLGFTFAPRYARNKFNSFLPAASDKVVKRLGKELRQFRLTCKRGSRYRNWPGITIRSLRVGSIIMGATTNPDWTSFSDASTSI